MKTRNPSNLPLIDYRKLVPLQGNLKDLTEANYKKLKSSMEKHDFMIPAFVWFDGETPYVVDAHQRLRVLNNEGTQFENTGYDIPYVEVEAKDSREAKEKLLLISSQYGTITYEGWSEFTAELAETELVEAVHFDALSLLGQEDDSAYDNKEVDPESILSGGLVTCPRCKFEFEAKSHASSELQV